MKRVPTHVRISDHAVLRYLEREHGLDVDGVREHLGKVAQPAAELGAVAVQVERVKLILVKAGIGRASVVTVVRRGRRIDTPPERCP